jgi:molybdenum cofactor cytidylyltransferase
MNGNLHIVILAAGESRRFGGNKLDTRVAGRALGRFALDSALVLNAARTAVVVSEPVPEFVREAADDGLADLILNPHARQGLATSVALAARYAAEADGGALLLMLADMPLVSTDTLRRLAESVAPGCPAAIRHADGQAGIPACFASDMFEALQGLSGGRGAAALLRKSEHVTLIEVAPAELHDIDTRDDLVALEELLRTQRRAV